MIHVAVSEEAGDWPAEIARDAPGWVRAALDGHVAGEAAVSVALADDATVRALNNSWRGQDKPTNVLSFAFADAPEQPLPPGEPRPLGDIVLALETMRAEALEKRRPFAHHACHLIVHGALHLAGLDHRDDDETDAMQGRETAILARLSLPDPYRD